MIGGSGEPIHRPQDYEELQGHGKDGEEAKHPDRICKNRPIEEESAGENPPGSEEEHEEDGQGRGHLKDHNVRVMPGGPGNDSLQKQCRQVLSEATKAKRLERGRQILKILRDGTTPPILRTDEKLFTMEAVHNIHNDRMLGTSKHSLGIDVLSHFRRQKPVPVMVSAGVTSDGKKTPLIFIEERVKIDMPSISIS